MKVEDRGYLHVSIGKNVKRVSLQRFLVSKIVYFPDKIEERDIFALYTNQLFLQTKALSDPTFNNNFACSLELLAKELKGTNLKKGVSLKNIRGLAHRLEKALPGFLVPKRNYQDWNHRLSGSYQLKTSQSKDVKTKELPLKRHIGVGYKDKGSTRDKAIDASPSWQEIASRVARLERELLELKEEGWNELTGIEKITRARYILSKRKELDRIKRVSF
jgi:hypothetical protein